MEKTIKAKLTFINGKSVLKYDSVSMTEELDGCDYYKAKVAEAIELNKKKAELETELEKINRQILQNRSEQLDLEKNGYCPIDYEQKKLVGTLARVEITHRPNCKHKGS